MPKHIQLITLLIASISSYAQINTGFETIVYDSSLNQPVFEHWKFGNRSGQYYHSSIDSLEKHSGKYSAALEGVGDELPVNRLTGHSIAFKNDFEGTFLTFSAYLKCQDVKGLGQLFVKASQRGNQLAFSNNTSSDKQMPVKGTFPWTRYYVNIRIPENADTITIGFNLAGKGKVWIDDIELYIDAKPLAAVPKKKRYKADDDIATFTDLTSLSQLNKTKINNLYLLGKVWGLLKYYHPAIAGGENNWDNELFRFLPTYLSVNNQQKRDVALANWIKQLGEIPVCTTCSDSVLKNAKLVPDFSWINTNNFSVPVQQLLRNIIANRYQGYRQYYIDLSMEVAQYKHEQAYNTMHYPPNVYRLLALYRFWNLIEYYFPNKHLIKEDREAILRAFIPQVVNAADSTSYNLALLQLVATAHDSHSLFNSPVMEAYYGNWWMPFSAKFIENKLVVTTIINPALANPADIRKGDIIEAIDAAPINELIKKWRPLIPASNESNFMNKLPYILIRGTKENAVIKIRRADVSQTVTVQKYKPTRVTDFYKQLFTHQNDSSFFLVTPSIGYLNLGRINNPRWKELLKGTEGLIIDGRQYPSGTPTLWDELGKFLLPDKMQVVHHGFADPNYPGVFTSRTIPNGIAGIENNSGHYKGKVVLLVNERTMSKGEYYSMMIRSAPGVKVVGSTTAGADGNNVPFYLPGDIQTSFSACGIYYPDGRETQRVGIVPDVFITPTIKGFMENRDEQLEAAIRIITGQ